MGALAVQDVAAGRSTGAPVALVCMPWGSIAKPSLAMALLKRCVALAGFTPELHHLNFRFAERLGLPLYEKITDESFFHPEWFFSQALFGPGGLGEIKNGWGELGEQPVARDMAARLARLVGGSEELCATIAHEHVPRFIDECLAGADWGRYMAVGFTTTFGQSLASLLLAARIKDRWPQVKIVFGGANVDAEMGVEFMRGFPWVDYVVHGEAEHSFPALLHGLAAGRGEQRIPGVSLRQGQTLVRGDGDAGPVVDLDTSPEPDYSDYLRELERSGFKKQLPWQLFFESSRGCWWGAKHHCTFCGLNGTTMAFRKKSPARVFNEIKRLSDEYRCLHLAATDNILSMDYFHELLPRLAELDTDIELFYEVKANLTRAQVHTLARGGIKSIQPGIESFSTRVLGLMRKGVTSLQNIQLLKWCHEDDIEPGYNILYGFPGEAPEDYRDLPQLFRLLGHLRPPKGLSRVMYERFSPYFFDRERFGLQLSPLPGYEFVFPESRVDLDKVAYFFAGSCAGQTTDPEEYIRPTREAWQQWLRHWEDETLFCHYLKGPNYVTIMDNRPRVAGGAAATRKVTLDARLGAVYLFCDESRPFQAICAMVAGRFEGPLRENELRASLDHLVFQGLMLREGERYLSLAVRRRPRAKRLAVA